MSQPRGPADRLAELIDTGKLEPDPAQQAVADALQACFIELVQARPRGLRRLFGRRKTVRGLYIHGSVGRGKTLLMDLFAHAAEQTGLAVQRVHFHRFMSEIHDRLGELEKQSDPLRLVARDIARDTRVLCLDEFHVGDIGDAMVLGELLDALFAAGTTLVTTSNTPPDELYADGLQRARFLPAIEAIKHHCRTVELSADQDYRLRELQRHPVYHCADSDEAEAELAEEFATMARGEGISEAALRVRGRTLQPRKRAGSVVWFEFATLCEGPRSSADYIELARRFGTLMISHVPQMGEDDNNAARRFIHLIDECYDRAVKLVIVAEAAPDRLYTGTRLAAAFERTTSRLIEMQSHDYLALPHRPD